LSRLRKRFLQRSARSCVELASAIFARILSMTFDSETSVSLPLKNRLRLPGALLLAAGLALSMSVGAETAEPAPAAGPTRSAWDGVFSKEQVERGRKVYNNECSRCHSDNLAGGEDSPTLLGKEFLANWDGKSLGKLVEYTREEMPSDGPGKITRRQSTDLAALMLSANGFPAGQADLPADLDTLKQILITPKK